MKIVSILINKAVALVIAALFFLFSGCGKERGEFPGELPLASEHITLKIESHGFNIDKQNLRLSMVFKNTSKTEQKFYKVESNSMGILYINWYRGTDGKKVSGEEECGKNRSIEFMRLKPGAEYCYETEGWENGNDCVLYTRLEPGYYYIQVTYTYAYTVFEPKESHDIRSNLVKVKVTREKQAKIRERWPEYFPKGEVGKK